MFQRTYRLMTFLPLMLLGAGTAQAAPETALSYNFLALEASNRSFSNVFQAETPDAIATAVTSDEVGLGLSGGVLVHDHIYLTGTYLRELDVPVTLSLTAGNELALAVGVIESRYLRFAVGGRWALTPDLDLNAEIGLENTAFRVPGLVQITLPSGPSLEFDDLDVDELKPDLAIGLRYLAGRHFEFDARVRYSSVQLRDVAVRDNNRIQLRDDVLFGVGILARLGKRIGLGLRWEGGDAETTTAQLRWRF